MNTVTVSAECLHRMCSACTYEDCACRCHLLDGMDDYADMNGDDAVTEALSRW